MTKSGVKKVTMQMFADRLSAQATTLVQDLLKRDQDMQKAFTRDTAHLLHLTLQHAGTRLQFPELYCEHGPLVGVFATMPAIASFKDKLPIELQNDIRMFEGARGELRKRFNSVYQRQNLSRCRAREMLFKMSPGGIDLLKQMDVLAAETMARQLNDDSHSAT